MTQNAQIDRDRFKWFPQTTKEGEEEERRRRSRRRRKRRRRTERMKENRVGLLPLSLSLVAAGLAASVFATYGCFSLASLATRRRGKSRAVAKRRTKKNRGGVLEAIGNTPLIRIDSLSLATGCEVEKKTKRETAEWVFFSFFRFFFFFLLWQLVDISFGNSKAS